MTRNSSPCRPIVRRASSPCKGSIRIKEPPQTADLAIYSQIEEWGRGGQLTWDSPHIVSWLAGGSMLSEVTAKVRNLSPRVGALDVVVHCYTSPFGIGMQRTRLSTQIIPIIAPASERTLNFPLTQALTESGQFLGIHILIDYPRDENRINNRGSQTVHVLNTKETGRDISVDFPVLNAASHNRVFKLTVLPNMVNAKVTPERRSFLPMEQISANLSMTVSADIPADGTAHRVTVVAVDDDNGSLIDGLTYVVVMDD
jgi:hypothetical protein